MGKLIVKMGKRYPKEDGDIKRLTKYIAGSGANKEQEHVIYTGAHGINKEHNAAAEQFIKTQRAFGKTDGRRAYHLFVSFEESINEPDVVVQAAKAVGAEIFQRYQVFYGIHTSTDNLHIHFAINAVSYVDGKKWHTSRPEFQEFKESVLERVNDVMQENDLALLTLS